MADTSLLINIGAKTSGAVAGIDQVNRKLGDLGDQADRASARSRGFAAGIEQATGPALATLTALGAAMGYAVSQASKLEQASGAMASVFKGQTAQMEAAAKAASQIGLSQADYSQIAAVLGSQLKNLGVSQQELVPQTQKLVGLGADLAAQFGGSTADAVAALSALFRGERDPIEQYGVSIKEADVQARLAQKGLTGLTGEAERQAVTLATMELLWEQTADAQGAAGREMGTFAGTMGRLRATLDNVAASIGETVLPQFTLLADKAEDLAVWVGANVDVVVALAASFGTLSAGILAARGAMIAFNIVSAINPWVLLGIAVAAAAAALVVAYQNFQPVRDAVTAVGDALQPLADDLIPRFKQLWEDLQPKFKEFADAVGPVAEENLPKLVDALADLGEAYVTYLEWWLPKLIDFLAVAIPVAITVATNALTGAVAVFGAVGAAVSTVVGWAQSFWQMVAGVQAALNTAMTAVQTVFGFILGFIGSIVGPIVSTVASAFGQVVSVIGSALNTAAGVVQSVWNTILSAITAVVAAVRGAVGAAFDWIAQKVFGSSEAARSAASNAWNGIVDAIRNALSAAVGVVTDLAGQVISALQSGFSGGFGAGADLGRKLVDGIKSMVGSAVQAARDLASEVMSALRGALSAINPVDIITGRAAPLVAAPAAPVLLGRSGQIDPTAAGSSSVGRIVRPTVPTVNVWVDGRPTPLRERDTTAWRRNYQAVA